MNSHYDKLVFNFINEYKLPLLLYIVVVLCTWPAETIVLSKLYGMLVGSLKTKFSMENIFHFQKNIEQQNMFGILTLVFIVYIIIIGFYRVKFAIEEKLIPEYIKYIRTLFIDGIIQNSSENFKDIRTGDYIQKIVEISNVLSQGLTQLANTFLPFFLGIIAVSFYYLYENIYLGGLSLFLCAIRLYLNISDGIWYSNVAAERDTYFFDMIEDVSDAFNNAMNIHLNNQASEEKERTEEQQKEYNKLYEKEIRTRSQLTIKRNIFTIISFVVLVVAAYYLYSKKKISFIVLLTVVMIEIKIIGRFIHFDETSLHFFSKWGTMTSSRSFLNEVLNDSKTTKSKCSPNDNSIVMKNVTFNYKTSGNNKTVFEKLNMTVNTGQKVALVGSSGSGKSTLMKLLVKLQKPTKGSVIIGGCDIQSMNTERLRDKITYVNQRTNLFNSSVVENIQYGNDDVTTEDVTKFIDKYKLKHIYSKLSDGIKTNAGVNGSRLSLGMQKITIILRGIFRNSDIIIFDEPLAGLDSETKEKVIQIINDIPNDKTVLVVTHDPEIISHMDATYPLSELHEGGKK